jgi:hypothetical protein
MRGRFLEGGEAPFQSQPPSLVREGAGDRLFGNQIQPNANKTNLFLFCKKLGVVVKLLW